MADHPSNSIRFPVSAAVVLLTTVAAAASGVAAVIAWPACGAIGVWAALYGGFSIWIAMLAGLFPLVLSFQRGGSNLINGYFGGMAIRAVVCVVAGVAGVYGLHLQSQPLLLTMASLYLPLLMVEVSLIHRCLSRQTPTTAPAASSPGGHA